MLFLKLLANSGVVAFLHEAYFPPSFRWKLYWSPRSIRNNAALNSSCSEMRLNLLSFYFFLSFGGHSFPRFSPENKVYSLLTPTPTHTERAGVGGETERSLKSNLWLLNCSRNCCVLLHKTFIEGLHLSLQAAQILTALRRNLADQLTSFFSFCDALLAFFLAI